MRKIYGLLLFIILISAVSIRFNLLDKHFSHVDDFISVQRYQTLFSEEGTGKFANINSNFFNLRGKGSVNNIVNPFIYAGYVSFTSTYAPIQFILTYFFINNNLDYNETLFWARFPSFIFSILSFIVLYIIFKRHLKNEDKTYFIGLLVLCLSWEYIIYSVQSETYAIGVFSFLICFLLFFNLLKSINELKLINAFLYGIIFSILILTNYQVIFILPALFFLIFIAHKRDFKNNIFKILCMGIPILITTGALYLFVLKKVSNAGVAWNAGLNNEFLYSINGLSFFDAIKYSFHFFINNILITFNSLVSFGDDTFVLNKVVSIFYLVCFIIGMFNMLISDNRVKKYFIYLIILSVSIFVVLILNGKLTLSPTRHSLIYLSFISLVIPEGVGVILKWFKFISTFYYNSIIISFCIIIIFLHLSQFNKIKENRIDKFKVEEITDLTNKYKISNIYSINWTWNLLFMNPIKKNYKHEFDKARSSIHFFIKDTSNAEKNILLISHREINSNILSKDIFANKIDFSKYKLLYQKEENSATEICHSNLTNNGTNGLYIYIYGVK